MKTINETDPMKTSDDGNITMTAEELRKLVNILHGRGTLDKEATPEGLRQTNGKSAETVAKMQDDSAASPETDGDEGLQDASLERANRDNAKVVGHDIDDDDAPASDAEVGECDGDDDDTTASDDEVGECDGDDDDTTASDDEIGEDDDEEDDDDESERNRRVGTNRSMRSTARA